MHILLHILIIIILYVLISDIIYNPTRVCIDKVISIKKNALDKENYPTIMENTKNYYTGKIFKVTMIKGLIFGILVFCVLQFIPCDGMSKPVFGQSSTVTPGQGKPDFFTVM